ncbi:NUDIX hydrolase [Paenibacillus sp. SYP-B3998]|uniref:NUDIX hydrolase n=1 Tax=Paenibacillus sp. SYP-B3998 TaxID=2678564 RepID=A0A6G4A478_9BACL|nr:NUDIX hydrolase [Paenibacillus sp. SYP-B3998]NEW09273.1 NUDIX hydrolase [Paenibacillus sp. SYP-B3998]
MEAKFCMSCGAALETRDVDGTTRRACTACSFVHWGNYSVGVGALVMRAGKLLLVRRAQEPGKGRWTNPGGYIEQQELIHDTIQREVLEETGVEAVVTKIVALRDLPRSIHNLYIAFDMEYVGGEPIPDGVEVDAAGFYSLEEMASMNVADFTRWLIDVAIHAESAGLVVDENPIVPMAGYGLYRVPDDRTDRK